MDHVGPVEAEEANMYGEIARLKEYISASEPTEDEIFEKACIEVRAFRRAALDILCRACAAQYESCPVCRGEITSRLRLFH